MSMFNIIPLILILISLSVVIVIIVRKFSALANLDVDNIPSEKEAKFKERLLSERLKRNFLKINFRFLKIYKPLIDNLQKLFKNLNDKLLELKEKNAPKKELSQEGLDKKIDQLFLNIDIYLKEDEVESAEKSLIEIIGLDPKNIRAFKLLGGLYYSKKNYEEAKQTYIHVLKLVEDQLGQHNILSEEFDGRRDNESEVNQAGIYYDLSLVYRDFENLGQAIVEIDKALLIEPNNPRFLDTLLEISIMNKDRENAENALKRLKEVNPDNQKIKDLSEKIKSI